MDAPKLSQPRSFVVLLSGTHVTGKETLAFSLSKLLGCPWLKGEMAHVAANFGARAQSRKGYDCAEVFGRIWSSKMQQIGLLLGSDYGRNNEGLDGRIPNRISSYVSDGREFERRCEALITCYAMRKHTRDVIRDVMLAHSVRPVFVIMQITKEALSGRTLGAEDPVLAAKIMETKMADIEEPLMEEENTIVVNSMLDVDALQLEIMEQIGQQLVPVRDGEY